MRFTISAPDLSEDTYETFAEYVNKRFSKINKFLQNKQETDHEIRVSLKKENHHYSLTCEVFIPEHLVIKSLDRDLRRVVDISIEQLKIKLTKDHEKKLDVARSGGSPLHQGVDSPTEGV